MTEQPAAEKKPRLLVLISGGGSNLQSFIDACGNGSLQAQLVAVISNRAGVKGLDRAAAAGIPNIVVDHRAFDSRDGFDQSLGDIIESFAPDLVVLAGFMRILTPEFVNRFLGKLINIHPSLLPAYPGLHTHQRAIDAGDKQAGATVHFVTPELDGGPPVLQSRIPILPDDTAATLAERVIIQEHVIYPLAARWYLEGRLTLIDQLAYLDGNRIPATGIDYREGLA